MNNSTTKLQAWFALPIFSRLPLIATSLLGLLLIGAFVSGCSDNNFTGSDENDNGDGTNQEDITEQATAHEPVDLGAAGTFVILAGGEITNVPTSSITGDLGISPAAGSSYTGFALSYTTGDPYAESAQVTGRLYASDYGSPTPANLTTAKGALTTAYNNAAGRTATDMVIVAGNLGGLTLSPGLYKSSGSLEISSGDLTFDAKGNDDAVFIIQVASTLTTASDRKVILSGGAQAANIFWQVGTSASLGTNSVFKGNILADQAISLATGASVEGRLLARIAAVTLEGNTIVKPAI